MIPQSSGSAITFDPQDARTTIYQKEQKIDQEITKRKRVGQLKNGAANGTKKETAAEGVPWEIFAFAGGAFVLIITLTVGAVYLGIKYTDST